MILIFIISFFFANDNRCFEEITKIKQFLYPTVFQDEDYEDDDLIADFSEDYEEELAEKISVSEYDQHLLDAAFYCELNKFRIKKKLPILKFNPKLRDAAFLHSYEMIKNSFFNHYNSKNLALANPKDRLLFCKYEYKAMAENIAFYKTPSIHKTNIKDLAKLIFQTLANSPEHYQNMISKEYDEVGCSIIISDKIKKGFFEIYATQDFGKGTMTNKDFEE